MPPGERRYTSLSRKHSGGLAPVVGHPHGFTVLDLADRDVAIEPPVAVVACPLDDDDLVELTSPAHLGRQLEKSPSTLAIRALPRTISPICGHCRTTYAASGTQRMYATRVPPSDSSSSTAIRPHSSMGFRESLLAVDPDRCNSATQTARPTSKRKVYPESRSAVQQPRTRLPQQVAATPGPVWERTRAPSR